MGIFSTHAELASYDRSTTILGVLAAFFTWTTLYFTLCLLNSKRSYEWNCRIVATVHAFVVCFMSYWVGFVQGSWPFTDAGAPNTKLQHWTCVLCLGYFIWDLIWCLYFQTEENVMLFHHLLSLYGNLHVLCTGYDGIEMVATIFGSELSNPFLQFRWYFRTCSAHRTWAAEINDHVFMLAFGFMRIGVGTYFLYTTLINPLPNIIVKIGACAIYTVSWIFWTMIIKYAIRKYTRIINNWKGKSLETDGNKVKDVGQVDHKEQYRNGVNYSTEELRNRSNNNTGYDKNGKSSHPLNNGYVPHAHVKSE